MNTDPSSDSCRTDSSLLEKVRDVQNHEAWERFITRYGPMIRGWCRHWFPREVDERVHDVFCELLFRMKTFEYDPSKGRFRGWLKTMANNLMADLKRAQWPHLRNLERDGDGAHPLDSVEAREDLAARLAAEYDLELLEQAKDRVRGRVEPRTWTVYEETAEQGRNPAEVALKHGMRVGAVYQAKHIVLAGLQREVKILERCS
jgi:RNA polymerase sigma-70 factor (ECF subfamily)